MSLNLQFVCLNENSKHQKLNVTVKSLALEMQSNLTSKTEKNWSFVKKKVNLLLQRTSQCGLRWRGQSNSKSFQQTTHFEYADLGNWQKIETGVFFFFFPLMLMSVNRQSNLPSFTSPWYVFPPGSSSIHTCVELVIVLSANIVAQSFTVEELSNAPCVSISSTAICWEGTKHYLKNIVKKHIIITVAHYGPSCKTPKM